MTLTFAAKSVMSAKLPRTKTEGNRYHVDALRSLSEMLPAPVTSDSFKTVCN